jgi:hypothetical protein
MGSLKPLGTLLVLIALAGCGGDGSSPQLVDGSEAPEVPAELEALDDAVLTRTAVKSESDLDDEYDACDVPRDSGDRTVVERTGVHGSSLTVESGYLVFGCDKIPDPATAEDPDLPYGGIWCGSPNGSLESGELNDPRLSLCPNTTDDITGFAWVEPQPNAKWVVVSDAGNREVYEVVEPLPVRVTTTDGTTIEGASALFPIEEYAADGSQVREYTLEARVAG